MKRRLIAASFFSFLAACGFFFGFTIFGELPSGSMSAGVLFYAFGRFAGMMGFIFLSSIIISGDTARFFDRWIGMDKIIKFQKKFAVFTTIFVVSHPIFFMLSDSFYLNYLLPSASSLPMALGTISLYIFAVVMTASVLYKRVSYNAWQIIHIATYFLFFFSLFHAINLGSDTQSLGVRILFGTLAAAVIGGAVFRTVYKVRQFSNRFEVVSLRWETKDTFTIAIKSNKDFRFRAGQFCFLRLNKDKLYARHPFTVSSSPGSANLEFTVKLEGRFTKAASKLSIGDSVIVEGPFGVFTVSEQEKPLVFIAGGVGITPFMSMLDDMVNRKTERDVTLIYGSRKKADTIFKKRLDGLALPGFRKVYAYSEENQVGPGEEKGFITKDILKKHVKDPKGSLYYICGPEGLKKSVLKALDQMGVKKDNIFIEEFFW
jgi:predicted ferric reductase